MHIKPPQCSQLPYFSQNSVKEDNFEPRGAGGLLIGDIEPRRLGTFFVHLAPLLEALSRLWKKVVYGII